MNQLIHERLNLFESISLKKMDGVKLMDRIDSKFIFKCDLLPTILKEVEPFYRCLEIETNKISTYKTLYYDTPDLKLYHKHHNGHLNRYKVRHRTYVDSNLAFLEVKFKSNKGRTVKERIRETNAPATFKDEAQIFLTKQLPFNPGLLAPVVWVNYGRITLVNKQVAERVTIDLNLQFVNGGTVVDATDLVIAEVKQGKKQHSEFLNILTRFRVKQNSISKYCLAVAMTHNNVKKNNFKEKILTIKKITTP